MSDTLWIAYTWLNSVLPLKWLWSHHPTCLLGTARGLCGALEHDWV